MTTRSSSRLPTTRGVRGAAVAALALALVASPTRAEETSRERAIVVLNNGSRVEVVRAWQEGDQYRLMLPSGGNVMIPAGQVRRVSRNASDLPQGRVGVAVAASPSPLPPAVESRTVLAADETPVADVRGSVPADPEKARALAPPSPETFSVLNPAPMLARGQAARAGQQPPPAGQQGQAGADGVAPSPTQARDLTPRPGRMQDLLQRINRTGARDIRNLQDR